MLPASLVTYIFFLASGPLVEAAGYATNDPQEPSCQGFDVISNDTQPLPSQNLIISTGVVCTNASTSCEVLSGSFPTLEDVIMYTNGSRVHDDYAIGYGLWNATGDYNTLWDNAVAAVRNQTVTFESGTSGYVMFTPTYRCVKGRVQGCPSTISIDNGTEVNACYPELDGVVSFEISPGYFKNITALSGSRFINETSAEVAAALKQIPNNLPPYGGAPIGAGPGLSSARIGTKGALMVTVIWVRFWLL
ncbi:hypothetical protein KCU99_g3183, partial [Aureobasidium melanogenum]